MRERKKECCRRETEKETEMDERMRERGKGVLQKREK